MNHEARTSMVSGTMLAVALWLLNSCSDTSTAAQAASDPSGRFEPASSRSVLSGATINVALGCNISSDHARVGDAWHGTVTEYVMTRTDGVIPPGSEVDGVVTGVISATPGSRAMLVLGVRGIRVNGHYESIIASADPVIAGSPHAHNLGVIDGTAAVGVPSREAAESGNNAPVDDHGGDAVGGDLAAGPNGGSIVLPDGTVVRFTVGQTVAMR
jgi:hypothetical protein